MFVLPPDAIQVVSDGSVDAKALWSVLWSERRVVLAIAVLFLVLGLSYTFLASKWYRSEVVMVPAQQKSSAGLVASLGGLASLAGIDVGSGASAEPLAVLRSREFAAGFIERQELVTKLFSGKWDSQAGRWKDDDPEDWPDIRDAVRYFHKKVLTVDEDPKTGLVAVIVEWKDPETAAAWAEMLVQQLNGRMRQRALSEAQANISYLQAELAATNVIALQQSIGRLLEAELQKLMLARGSEDFSFRVVDRPVPAKRPTWPNALLVMPLSVIVGLIAASFVVYARQVAKRAGNGILNSRGEQSVVADRGSP